MEKVSHPPFFGRAGQRALSVVPDAGLIGRFIRKGFASGRKK
jgi:hypothetical protein